MLQLANSSDFQAFDYYDWYKSGTISVKVNPDIDTPTRERLFEPP